MTDPFASIPDAQRSDFQLRTGPPRPEQTCGMTGKAPRKKRVDLNPIEARHLTAQGYTFKRVEHKSGWTGRLHDLWGADFLCIREPGEFLLVQVTTHSEASKRVRKLEGIPEIRVWLACGGRVVVHGWRQPGGAGSRWECVEREVTLPPGRPAGGEGRWSGLTTCS